MKKYKFNYLFTPMFQICSLLISFFPGIFLMWLLINPNEGDGVLYIFPVYIVLILFFYSFRKCNSFIDLHIYGLPCVY